MYLIVICLVSLLKIHDSRGSSSERIRIPNTGETCNVVNLNFGGEAGESKAQVQMKGDPGFPGKKGIPGVEGQPGGKGEKGERGLKGEKGSSLNSTELKMELLKILAATSCQDLKENHGVSVPGHYLMRKENSSTPEYVYCDFKLRQDYIAPHDCTNVSREDAKISNATGGVFDISFQDPNEKSVEVYCDLTTDGGGWTVFQRRMDGSVDFYRNWNAYVRGFGEKDKEMWLGLETIHQLTKNGRYELRIDLSDWEGNDIYAKYSTFAVASAEDNYRLTVNGYSGNAKDSMAFHNGYEFSTLDADNDPHSEHCANYHHGGWWYRSCAHANLNGLYYQGGVYGGKHYGIFWAKWKNDWKYSMKFTEMKFRKVN